MARCRRPPMHRGQVYMCSDIYECRRGLWIGEWPHERRLNIHDRQPTANETVDRDGDIYTIEYRHRTIVKAYVMKISNNNVEIIYDFKEYNMDNNELIKEWHEIKSHSNKNGMYSHLQYYKDEMAITLLEGEDEEKAKNELKEFIEHGLSEIMEEGEMEL